MPLATDIVTLPQTKDFLRIEDTESDTILPDFISTASQMIVNRIGPVAGTPPITGWYDGGSARIVLDDQPVRSITTVVETLGTISYTLNQIANLEDGSSDAYAYTVDLDEALLIRRAAGIAIRFAPGIRNIKVTYVAGYDTVPADLTQACLVLVKHLFDTQRGAGTVRPGTGGRAEMPGASYSMPNRVMEILSPYLLPGIA